MSNNLGLSAAKVGLTAFAIIAVMVTFNSLLATVNIQDIALHNGAIEQRKFDDPSLGKLYLIRNGSISPKPICKYIVEQKYVEISQVEEIVYRNSFSLMIPIQDRISKLILGSDDDFNNGRMNTELRVSYSKHYLKSLGGYSVDPTCALDVEEAIKAKSQVCPVVSVFVNEKLGETLFVRIADKCLMNCPYGVCGKDMEEEKAHIAKYHWTTTLKSILGFITRANASVTTVSLQY